MKKYNQLYMAVKKVKEDNVRAMARGGFIALTGLFIGKIIGYLYTIFATRLGVHDYGLLSLASVIVSFAVVFSIIGLDQGVTRYVAYYNGKNDRKKIKGAVSLSLKIVTISSLIITFLIFIFSKPIAINIFHSPDLTNILRIMVFTIPLISLTYIFLSILKAFKKIEYDIGAREIVEKSIRLVVFTILFFIGFGVFGAAISYVMSAIGMFLFSLYFLHRNYPDLFSLKAKEKPDKEIINYSFPLLLTGILVLVIAWTDLTMLGYFKTPNEVGIYSVAITTASLMFVLPSAIISLFLPIITELYSKKQNKQIIELYKRVSRWIFLVNFPIMLIMLAFSKKIIQIIFGQDYVLGASALSILSFGYLIYSMSYTSGNVISMIKKTKPIFFITLSFALTNIILNFILIPRYSLYGAAIATSTSFLIGGGLLIFYNFKKMKMQPFSKEFIKIACLGVLSMILVYLLHYFLLPNPNFFLTIMLFLLFLLIYLLLVLYFKIIDKQDWDIINLFKNKIFKMIGIPEF